MSAVPLRGWPYGEKEPPDKVLARMGVDASSPDRLAATVPFGPGDTTCGCENELQAVVTGDRQHADLPMHILESNYFRNLIRRHRRGELPRQAVSDLEQWLTENTSGVWENSWVRIPVDRLSPIAQHVYQTDLLADKENPQAGRRSDWKRFLIHENNRQLLRVPVSYMLKLALAQALGSQKGLPSSFVEQSLNLGRHFLCDNTSPETYSFHVVSLDRETGMGRAAAEETCRRFLLTQLLTQYAERALGLAERGQEVSVYFAPHPPVRQKQLSECISDAFYRELFMNPCLSGWDKGEDKARYMHLCHEVLSRAQFNSLGRLKEAGIITNNLVTLPSASNIGLANNGTHISLGSRRLSRAMAQRDLGVGQAHEKYLGDLAIKFVEHFLPLFVGTYSAAPYRLAFRDMHPEKVLTFLPYQLDYTHLRMLWRRWKKKAVLKVKPLGLRLTPFGPPWVDEPLSRLFGLRGDHIPDYRLLDYLVSLMSTDQSPALDGRLGNQKRLKMDLSFMGVFHPDMPVYLPYRQRDYAERGFSGFEGRHYSLFHSLSRDLGPAAELQNLVTALAFAKIAEGGLDHDHIPDDPMTESERRQIFFGAAVGLPTFYVRQDTPNRVLRAILENTGHTRSSRRYPGYIRVKHHEYRLATARLLCKQAAELIEAMGMAGTMRDLLHRLTYPHRRPVASRVTRDVLRGLGAHDPLKVEATQFNQAAEDYYRNDLRRAHIKESWEVLEHDLRSEPMGRAIDDPCLRSVLSGSMGSEDPSAFLQRIQGLIINNQASTADLLRLINLLLIDIQIQTREAEGTTPPEAISNGEDDGTDYASIHTTA